MLTRDADYFVPLQQRVAKARRVQADRQGHMFLEAARCAHCAGVFAPMAGVDGDGDQPADPLVVAAAAGVRLGGALVEAGLPGGFRLAGCFRGSPARGLVAALRRADTARSGLFGRDLFEQRQQRVDRLDRVEVEHQPVAVLADRGEGEHLRCDLGLELDHQPDDARPVAAGADQLDVRVLAADLGRQGLQDVVELHPFQVHHQPLGVAHRLVREVDRAAALEGDAGVVAGRPHPHCQHRSLGCLASWADHQQQGRPGGAQKTPPGDRAARHVALQLGGLAGGRVAVCAMKSLRHVWPSGLSARSESSRPPDGATCSRTSRSAAGR